MKSSKIIGKMLKGDERTIDVEITFIPFIRRTKNRESLLLVQIKDITVELENEKRRLMLHYIADHSVNPLQITDLKGSMIYVNTAYEKLSGYKKEELLGKNPRIFSSKRHSKEFWNEMWQTVVSGKPWTGEVMNRKKNGEIIHTRLLVSPIVGAGDKVVGYFGLHSDLTDKRILEKQLIHTQKMESIGTLAAGVAHEVGNPLASISALVQILQRSSEDEFVKEKLDLVVNQVKRISKIIRDLVDFSRPSNYELEPTDVNDNIREAMEIVRVGKKAKDIEFELDLDDSVSLLHLVTDQMQQVFVNMFINAVDAIAERKKNEMNEFEGRIFTRTEETASHIIVTIEDNGCGIAEDKTQKVFEPFFTTKEEGEGTGLGLWVSYGIIKSFKGSIKITSAVNEGTVFIISLPTNPIY
jgi:PAS domain S-box-containing protein